VDIGVAAALGLFGLVLGGVLLRMIFDPGPNPVLLRERSFFGVLRVEVDRERNFVQLVHGRTTHGQQSRDPGRRRDPLTYYHHSGPIGQVFAAFDGPDAKRRVGVIGLGAGTLAAYAEAGQHWTFFEIDPAVARIAEDPHYFTYLRDGRARQARLDVVLGDGRIRLKEAGGPFGLLVIDAFNSDAIPTHLLTREALRLYLDRLADDGVLAVHISSHYVRLAPVLAALAEDAGLAGLLQQDRREDDPGKYSSDWVLLARRREHFGKLVGDERWKPLAGAGPTAVWTDKYVNLFAVLDWEGQGTARTPKGRAEGLGHR
jgi:hypothetical protein